MAASCADNLSLIVILRGAKRSRRISPTLSEILPLRITPLNQGNLPLPVAVLDFLLKADRCGSVLTLRIPDQTGNVIFAGESSQQTMLVLVYASLQIAGDSDNKVPRLLLARM